MQLIITEACVQMGNVFGTKDAAEWGVGFEIPAADVAKDVACLGAAGNNLDVMIERRKAALESDRFSVDRGLRGLLASTIQKETNCYRWRSLACQLLLTPRLSPTVMDHYFRSVTFTRLWLRR